MKLPRRIPWNKKSPEEWDRIDARDFAKHLMEPVAEMMANRVLMIMAACAGKDLNEAFPHGTKLGEKL